MIDRAVRRGGAGTASLALLLALLPGCGKAPEATADPAAERAEATKRAQQRDFGGAQVKALEEAKKIESDVNKLATDSVNKAEKDAK